MQHDEDAPIHRLVARTGNLDAGKRYYPSMGIELPDWGQYLVKVGNELSQIPPVEYGEMAPRVVLSVPTGRFTYWLLTAGALLKSPVLANDYGVGDVVATWDNRRMIDSSISDGEDGRWKLASGMQVIEGDWPAVKLPEETPEDRRAARIDKDYKEVLMKLPGRKFDWHKWFAQHCLKPVVIVGTGREHIQRQRETLLRHVPSWFSDETFALLNEDSSATSNPQRMLFHPYMVFDAGVGQGRPWLRQMLPRLVVITSWSSRNRIHQSMFSRVPQIIITNRRVRSAVDVEEDLREVEETSHLDHIIHANRPQSIQARVFQSVAQGEIDEDLDEEWFI